MKGWVDSTYINFRTIRPAGSRAYLRCRIRGRTDASGNVVRFHDVWESLVDGKLTAGGQAKISNLDVVRSIAAVSNEYVFRLQVSMNDAQTVNMGKTLECLPEKAPYFRGVLIEFSGDQVT